MAALARWMTVHRRESASHNSFQRFSLSLGALSEEIKLEAGRLQLENAQGEETCIQREQYIAAEAK